MSDASSASKLTTRDITFSAVGCALMAVSAWVTIPVGPVPFTLQTMVATMLAVIFGPKRALLTMAVYVVLGAVGIPVFSGMRGGMGVLFGPTGGFIVALIPAMVLAQLILGRVPREENSARARGIRLIAGLALVAVMYLFGWLWLMYSTGMGPVEAFLAACAPFIVPDIAKVFVGVGLGEVVSSAVPALVHER